MEKRFFAGIDRATKDAWPLATSVDLRVPNREGDGPPPGFKLVCRYNDRLMRLVCHHRTAACRFAEVIHLLRSPTSLVAPRILLAALLGGGGKDGMLTNGAPAA